MQSCISFGLAGLVLTGALLLAPDRAVEAQSATLTGWSHCSSGNAVADPGGVRGVFVAGANQVPNPAVATAVLNYLPTDPTICGANLIIPWSAIDNGPGANPQYDWSFLDQAAAPWLAAGKIVNLIVWGTDEKPSQELNGVPATPAYVLNSSDTVTCSDGAAIPLYWSSAYQQPWRTFEAALVAHVAGNATVGYIRFGLGTGGEDFPVIGFEQSECLKAWTAKGLTAARWQDLSIAQVDYEASLGSDHPLNVGINSFPGAPRLPARVAEEAVKNGMGFGMQGMTTMQIRDAQARTPCYADWCALFQMWTGQVPLEVQTLTESRPSGGGLTGALPDLLACVVNQAHAQVLELDPQEWLVADDPSWPTYPEYHDAYTQALGAAAAAVGGDANTFTFNTPPPSDTN